MYHNSITTIIASMLIFFHEATSSIVSDIEYNSVFDNLLKNPLFFIKNLHQIFTECCLSLKLTVTSAKSCKTWKEQLDTLRW